MKIVKRRTVESVTTIVSSTAPRRNRRDVIDDARVDFDDLGAEVVHPVDPEDEGDDFDDEDDLEDEDEPSDEDDVDDEDSLDDDSDLDDEEEDSIDD